MPRSTPPATARVLPRLTAFALLALGALAAHADTFPRYQVVDLGYGEAYTSYPGQGAAGQTNLGAPQRWFDDHAVRLGAPDGRATVLHLNAAGAAAGDAMVNGVSRPIRWTSDGQWSTPFEPGDPSSSLTGLDEAGTMIGLWFPINGTATRGYVVSPDGQRTAFPLAGAGDYSLPLAISPGGLIAAEVEQAPQGRRECAIYANGQFTILGATVVGGWCSPVAIADSGHVAADRADKYGAWHGALWADGRWNDIGSLGGNYVDIVAMNAHDVIIGDSAKTRTKQTEHFVWAEGSMHALPDLLDDAAQAAGWRVTRLHGIDDEGRISCYGHQVGQWKGHALLLVPHPKP